MLYSNDAKAITDFRGEYRFLSNFDDHPVVFEGIKCASSEAAFQMMKTFDINERIRLSKMTPGAVKKAGKKVKLRSDWEQVKDQIMYNVVLAKFKQNPDIKEKLLATGDAHLVEGNTWRDYYWGVCNGTGKNKLGVILMMVREELRKEVR